MRNTMLVGALALLLGLCTIFGQTAFKKGVFTDQTNLLPSDLAGGYIYNVYTNAKESFILGRTQGGEIKIYRSTGGPYIQVATESQFGTGKLAGYAKLTFGPEHDYWSIPDMELRPDGLHFDLYTVTLTGGTATDQGSGGSYRIVNGVVQKFLAPGDSIAITDSQGVARTVEVKLATTTFPKSGGGEYIYLKTKDSRNAVYDGIFLKEGTKWTQVLPFFISTQSQGFPIPYGLGRILAEYGIVEALDGTISFMEFWGDMGGSYKRYSSFNPKTKALKVQYQPNNPILGTPVNFTAPHLDTLSGTRFWRVANGPNNANMDYIFRAPNPGFVPAIYTVRSQIPEFNIWASDLRGLSENMALYGLMKNSGDGEAKAVSIWDGTSMQLLFQNGDVLPNGKTIIATRNKTTGISATGAVYGCRILIPTFKTDGTVDMLIRYDKPCIADAAASGGQIIIVGKNLTLSENTRVLVDGIPASNTTITSDRITFPSTGIGGGNKKVVVSMSGGQVASNEATVIVPLTTPAPAITNVVSVTFQNTPLSPGALFTVRGTNLSPVTYSAQNPIIPGITVPIVKPGEPAILPTQLGGVEVLVNGRQVPLLFAGCLNGSTCQVNAQAPVNLTGSTAQIEVRRYTDINGLTLEATSQKFNVVVQAISPSVFKNGDGLPILQVADRDYQLVDKEAPVRPDETVVGYATGWGLTSPVIPEGLAAKDVVKGATATVTSTVKAYLKYQSGGETQYYQAEVVYAVASPEFAGLQQFALKLPTVLPDEGSKVFLIITVGDETVPDMELNYSPN